MMMAVRQTAIIRSATIATTTWNVLSSFDLGSILTTGVLFVGAE